MVGERYWQRELPVWDVMQRLAAGRPMADHLFCVDTVERAVALLVARCPSRDGVPAAGVLGAGVRAAGQRKTETTTWRPRRNPVAATVTTSSPRLRYQRAGRTALAMDRTSSAVSGVQYRSHVPPTWNSTVPRLRSTTGRTVVKELYRT